MMTTYDIQLIAKVQKHLETEGMNLRQRRVTVVTTLGGTPQQIQFGFIPLGAPSNG